MRIFKTFKSISLAQVNFRWGPIMCTTFYGIPISEELRWPIWRTFPLDFFCGFHTRHLSTFSIPWCKKSQKWPKTQIKGSSLKKQKNIESKLTITHVDGFIPELGFFSFSSKAYLGKQPRVCVWWKREENHSSGMTLSTCVFISLLGLLSYHLEEKTGVKRTQSISLWSV